MEALSGSLFTSLVTENEEMNSMTSGAIILLCKACQPVSKKPSRRADICVEILDTCRNLSGKMWKIWVEIFLKIFNLFDYLWRTIVNNY